MDNAITGALAALGGSLIGAMAPVVSNYVIQRGQTRRDLIAHQITQRELLYSDFIKKSALLHAKSLEENLQSIDEMVELYAMVSTLRLMSSDHVLREAEKVVEAVARQYGEQNLTLAEIESAGRSGNMDILGAFSSACRREMLDIIRFKWDVGSRRRGRLKDIASS